MAKKETNTKLEVAICDLKDIDSINIESLIRVIRGQQVMLDSDLAMLYGVETKALNQAVKRNINRFPEDFMFQLTKDEASRSRSQIATLDKKEILLRSQIVTSNLGFESLRSQIVTIKNGRGQHTKYLPYAFTRNGIAMLSSVLRSDTAVEVDRVLSMFTKRADGVSATIHTRYNEQFLTDLQKHNIQYPEIKFIQLPQRNHDRFLIIDDKVYLLGASLKDIGTGLCAITEMTIAPEIILGLLK